MQKLDVWSQNSSYLSSVQVTLTNGETSPVFKTDGGDLKNQCSIDVCPDVSMVGIKCDGTTLVAGLKFLDNEDFESKWEYGYSSW